MIEDYMSPQNVWIINHDYRSMYVFLYETSSLVQQVKCKSQKCNNTVALGLCSKKVGDREL